MMAQRVAVAASNGRLIRFFQELAQSRGWNFRTALTGKEALALASSSPPDLLVIDAFLDGLNGVELRGRLQRDPATQMLPTMLVAFGCDTPEELTFRLEIGRFRCRSLKTDLRGLAHEAERWVNGSARGMEGAAQFRYPLFIEAAGEACHAANQPLTSLICSAELMLRQDLDEGLRARAKLMHESATKIMQVIRGLQKAKREEEEEYRLPIYMLPHDEVELSVSAADGVGGQNGAGK